MDVKGNVDARMERAGKKGHRYVKKSFKKRREKVRQEWLQRAGKIVEEFDRYLKQRLRC